MSTKITAFRSVLFALAVGVCADAGAQDKRNPSPEDEIVVEGTRLNQTSAESGTAISIITADDIELRGYAFALDALASASGVTINQNGAFGGLATVSIRGAATDQTLVIVDGVPFGDPTSVGGGYDFSILDPADIARIEILKGPQSTLWGSDAIGGVINIVTKRPTDDLGGRLFVEGGSFGTFRGGAAVSGGNDAGDFRLGVSGVRSGGISKADEDDGNTERDAYHGLSFSGRGGVNLPAGLRLEGVARHMEGETEIDGFPPPNFTLADSDDRSRTTQTTGAATLIAPLFGDRLNNRFMAGYTDILRTGEFDGFETRDDGNRLILRYLGSFDINDRNRLAAGAEREATEANGEETSINSVFGLYELKPVDRLTLTAGVRLDDHSRFGSETTARAAAAFAVTDELNLRGSWSEGFKAPTIFQLTSTFGALPPNGDLEPETSEAFDLGFDILIDEIAFSATYFNRDTDNLIIFAPNFRYENLDRTQAQGVEADFTAPLYGGFSFVASYAYIDAENAVTGERQIRVPRHSGDAELRYRRDRFSGAVALRYNGEETEGAFGEDVERWVRVDLSGAFRLTDTFDIYGRVENLLDEDYQQVSGFGTPGISGFAGVRASF